MATFNKRTMLDRVLSVVIWLYAALSIYPLVWLVFYSFKTNGEIFVTNRFGPPLNWNFDNYVAAWHAFDMPRYFFNSVAVSLGSVLLTLVVAPPFAYAVARFPGRLMGPLRTLVVSGLFLPAQIVVIPLMGILARIGLSDSLVGLGLVYAAAAVPFTVLVFYAHCRTYPIALEEAAAMEGAGRVRIFFDIVLPSLMGPALVVAVLNFLTAWNEFILAFILISDESKRTLPLAVLLFQGTFGEGQWGAFGASLVLASVPALIFYIVFTNQIERGIAFDAAVK